MQNLDLDSLKNMPESKLVFVVDSKYKASLKRVITSAMSEFYGIPAEWEDFYYEFLAGVFEMMKEYNGEFALSTFLSSKCRYFVKNKCRHLSGNKFAMLNNAVEAVENFTLRDSGEIPLAVDLSTLNRIEMKVYEAIFLEGLTFVETAKKLELSKFKLKCIYETVLRKLKPQLEKN